MTASSHAAASTAVAAEAYPYAASERLKTVFCSTLGVAPGAVTADLAYQDIAEWDSMGHVSLMLALEKAFSTTISRHLVPQLTSMSSLSAFVAQLSGAEPPTPMPSRKAIPANQSKSTPTVNRGLVGIHFDRSVITEIDPSGSALRYRGYSIDDLVD